MALNVTTDFETSYTNFDQYPCNLCDPHVYPTTLVAFKDRLNNAADTLCVHDGDGIHLPVRDLLPTAQDPNILEFKKRNIFSQTALGEWLGNESSVDPLSNTRTGNLVTKPDPLIRFIFLYAADSRSQLKVTKQMLVTILSYHQVMPAFLEFVLLFGLQARPVDLRYSGFREETSLGTPFLRVSMPALCRSAKHFELCYNLKGVTQKASNEWSIRHSVVYHKFDITFGSSLWIIVKGSLDLKDRLEPMTRKQCERQDQNLKSVEACFASSLEIHLLVAHWAAESWRWYLQYLENLVEEETKDARYGDFVKSPDDRNFTSQDLQKIQFYIEKASEILTVLESNIEVLSALRTYYMDLVEDTSFPFRMDAQAPVSSLKKQLNHIIYDFKMQSARAKLLIQEIQSRKDLILQHLQNQNTRSMTELTLATYEISKIAQKDAIAIRIITIVTLFYLPGTFVSSFFSTDVVRYQDPDSSPPNSRSSFSQLAMWRWLQVALPLTVFTLMLSYCGYRMAKRHVRKHQQFHLVPVPG